ncbi:bifunctional [glutamine synthetase] adenylyltransferase/[glutamine synthetase]-adenylyl-L-tyrosine phosphorylase [Henriciella aquimarina]|uniref:bifunctional [glutamine synthetase] adenylyltransferase/[glutamine synthetase]-adenylyl-L-tyrosine phosphorylase n=1 Tax=Henriciella aquimarina TaxID=545261 RepID=UPI000A004DAA|nr:bifunctional [glutamine synthetase] adenylyltransferase/[glutamine synthetase]-adenylyl-L-tyrosine phosphorylase [Henriciella aquimarina]
MLEIRPLSQDAHEAFELASQKAPYLARAARRAPEVVAALKTDSPADLAQKALDDAAAAASLETVEEAMAALRHAKLANHIAVAAMDLSGAGDVMDVTGHLTEFADQAVQTALDVAFRKRGISPDGLFVVALGKMGAFELNYSSDIDMAVFYDPDVFDGGEMSASEAASRVIRDAMRILEEQTGEGYVFRTDLRLRPDPSSTPPAVSTSMAEIYYESVGQNWERMVWIKARPCAGDKAVASRFLDMMQPFVWRRHMDYWAIADVQAIKRMINDRAGAKDLRDPAPDVKLGPGGIREIEFFVQTQQVIMGGRNDFLRHKKTLKSLDALVAAGAVAAEVGEELTDAYNVLRAVEHRIQMLEDEQTHSLPKDEEMRARVAALCGQADLAAFDKGLSDVRSLVSGHYRDLFAEEERKTETAAHGNLVFTGVDDDPGTVETLKEYGFSEPSRVIATISNWHRGKTPATRTARGRGLLTALLPDLLDAMRRTGEPDTAFARFSRFFEGLRTGVQTLSMLLAENELLEDLVTTLAIAPRLSETLARRPGLLEALVSPAGQEYPPALSREADFESQMDEVRRWQNERAFLIGHRLLHSRLPAAQAALAWSDLADACTVLMAEAAAIETARKYGPQPGHWTIGALGKLGGREMTAGSDLDLIIVFEAEGDAAAEAGHWFTKFAQRLITAISAETAEGSLYEVDMRLRPSGRAGPVAVAISAFDRYQHENAWTFELMALTRLRPVAGNEALGERMLEIARDAIAQGKPEAERKADILDMRRRLWKERPPRGKWDLKLTDGGLIDLEFILQQGMLTQGRSEIVSPITGEVIEMLTETGYLDADEATALSKGFTFLQSIQQIQRLAVGSELTADQFSKGLKARLALAAGCEDFNEVETRYSAVTEEISRIRCKKIGTLATDS